MTFSIFSSKIGDLLSSSLLMSIIEQVLESLNTLVFIVLFANFSSLSINRVASANLEPIWFKFNDFSSLIVPLSNGKFFDSKITSLFDELDK